MSAPSPREVERGAHLVNGWDPYHNQPTDLFATFSDADFRLGLDGTQTTPGALAELAGLKVAVRQLVDNPLAHRKSN